MKNKPIKKIVCSLLCVLIIALLFSSCKDKVIETADKNVTETSVGLNWIIEPCIEADKISALIHPVFNDNTNHYDMIVDKYCVINKDGKCGLIDMYGGTIINADYDEIFAIRDGDDYIGKIGSSQTYIHSDTFETEPAYRTYNSKKYEYYYNVNDNKVYFGKNTSGDKTTIDEKPVLPEVVIGVDSSKLKENGKYGLYVNNKEITNMLYSNAGYYNDGVVAVKKDNKWGYIDSLGQTVIPFELDAVKGYNAFSGDDTPYESNEGYITVCKNGKFAFYSNSGKKLCDFIYDDATPCINGRAYVLYEGKWGIVSLNESENTLSDITTSKAEKSTTTKIVSSTTANIVATDKKYVVSVETLKLRKAIDSESFITLLDEDDVVFCDKTSGEWAHLVFDGYDGWVRLEYLKEVD